MFAACISAACLLKDRKENRTPANTDVIPVSLEVSVGLPGAVMCQTRSLFSRGIPGQGGLLMKPSPPFSFYSLSQQSRYPNTSRLRQEEAGAAHGEMPEFQPQNWH